MKNSSKEHHEYTAINEDGLENVPWCNLVERTEPKAEYSLWIDTFDKNQIEINESKVFARNQLTTIELGFHRVHLQRDIDEKLEKSVRYHQLNEEDAPEPDDYCLEDRSVECQQAYEASNVEENRKHDKQTKERRK